jgi:hypothetical protein
MRIIALVALAMTLWSCLLAATILTIAGLETPDLIRYAGFVSLGAVGGVLATAQLPQGDR